MTNKYLEKIAAGIPKVGIMANVVHPILGVGADIAKGIGRDFHTATGGGFRDLAVDKHGVKLQSTLRKIHGKDSFLSTLHENALGTSSAIPTKETLAPLEGLQKDQKKAIIKSVGYSGAALYGGNKVLGAIRDRQDQQNQYYNQGY